MRNIYLIIAKQIIEEAGRIIKEARATNTFGFSFKNDNTPITNIDRQVQQYITKRLQDSFEIQVMGEEYENNVDISKPYWAVDPIDGTWAFITHENTSAINLSLIDGDEVILGIVFNPFTDEFYHTEKESEAYIGMLKLPLRDNEHVTVVNFKPEREHPIVNSLNQLFKEEKIKKLVSIGGSITYSICMVAKGAFSNYIAHFADYSSAWDLSAAVLVLRNSGGFVTDLEGNDINPVSHKGYIVASANEKVKDEFLAMIKVLSE
ncbi:inositol monophosphatase [bacterium]|nr:inositol monophosphatase [bacterium]MBU1989187.1 inositol monophosphatase [bacterium]